MERTNKQTWIAILLLPLASAAAACSDGGNVDIGESTGGKLSDYAASWDGYAEAYTFPGTMSDRVRLTLDANGRGNLRFGDAPLLPPATDPNVGYPPGASIQGFVVHDGFEYPVYDTRVETSRLQLGAWPEDFYAGWCTLQTMTYAIDGGGVYTCLPPSPGGTIEGGTGTECALLDASGTPMAFDCLKLALCERPGLCACGAAGCAPTPAPTDVTLPVTFDGALDGGGTMLVGTLVLGNDRVTVRLQRQ
jgi:hypothetical protein